MGKKISPDFIHFQDRLIISSITDIITYTLWIINISTPENPFKPPVAPNAHQISGFLSNWEACGRKELLWDSLVSTSACVWSTDASVRLKTLLWDHTNRRAVEGERAFKVTAVYHVILEYHSEHLLLLSSAKWVTYIDTVTTRKTYLEHFDICERLKHHSIGEWGLLNRRGVSSSVPVWLEPFRPASVCVERMNADQCTCEVQYNVVHIPELQYIYTHKQISQNLSRPGGTSPQIKRNMKLCFA